MAKLYFLRHGQPAFPPGEHVCLGSTDLPLSETGKAQAAQAAARFSGMDITVYSSPQRRAIETAAAFARPVHILSGLRERHMGVWDGLPFSVIRQRFPDLYAARGADMNLMPEGAEPEEMVAERFRDAVERIRSECAGDALVISHSAAMTIGLGIPKLAYCEIAEVEI